jgi:hypothetical protein
VHVIDRHVDEQVRFAHSGLAQAKYMVQAISGLDAEDMIVIAPVGLSYWGVWLEVMHALRIANSQFIL